MRHLEQLSSLQRFLLLHSMQAPPQLNLGAKPLITAISILAMPATWRY